MKKCLLLTLGCSFLLLCSDLSAVSKPNQISVATWNLKWFFDSDTSDNTKNPAIENSAPDANMFTWKLTNVANVIASMSPTIIGLQEIEDRQVLESLTARLSSQHNLNYGIAFTQGLDTGTEQDVAILYRQDTAELLFYGRRYTPRAIIQETDFKDLSKHLVAHFRWGGNRSDAEYLTVIVVHLRASGGAPVRMRQARTLRHWLNEYIEHEENVIVLGDFNTKKRFGSSTEAQSGVGIIRGLGTPTDEDDLYDLNNDLVLDDRATFRRSNDQLDRLLLTQSLISDFDYKDLVFNSVANRRDLVVQGVEDVSHTDYWGINNNERDYSDHFPLIATFDFVD